MWVCVCLCDHTLSHTVISENQTALNISNIKYKMPGNWWSFFKSAKCVGVIRSVCNWQCYQIINIRCVYLVVVVNCEWKKQRNTSVSTPIVSAKCGVGTERHVNGVIYFVWLIMFRFISMAISCIATLYCSFANQRHWFSDVHSLFFGNLCSFVCVDVVFCLAIFMFLFFSVSVSFLCPLSTLYAIFSSNVQCPTQTPPHAISLLPERHRKSQKTLVWNNHS